MNMRMSCGLSLLAVLLVSAAEVVTPLEMVRAGNAAYEAEDYAAALEWYARAEVLITDPGLVAFNKAAALYRLGSYDEAEAHYLRCLEDAVGSRRARVFFDLGNSLVQQSRGEDAQLLDRAVGYYEDCLRLAEVDPVLREDAQANLALAKTLRQQAQDHPKDPMRANQAEPRDQPDTSRPGGDDDPATESTGQGDDKHGSAPGDKGKARVSRRPRPGTGTLPPVPDEDALATLPPEAALEHLQRVADRIARERKKQLQRAASPSRHALDW